MAFQRAVVLYAMLLLKQRVVGDKQADLRMHRRARAHKTRLTEKDAIVNASWFICEMKLL